MRFLIKLPHCWYWGRDTSDTFPCSCFLYFKVPFLFKLLAIFLILGFPGGSEVKASACNVGDLDAIPGNSMFFFFFKYIFELFAKPKLKKKKCIISLGSLLCCCSVTQLYPTLCDPTDCRTSGLPVPHHRPKFSQVHVHCIGDAIQPSHPLVPSSPSALNLSQHQGL